MQALTRQPCSNRPSTGCTILMGYLRRSTDRQTHHDRSAMPRTITKTYQVYSFKELSESAKNRARDKWREHDVDYGWWDSVFEDAVKVGECLGIEIASQQGKHTSRYSINFSGFSSQAGGACFAGTYTFKPDCVAVITTYAPKDEALKVLAEKLTTFQVTSRLIHGSTVSAQIRYGQDRYTNSQSMRIEVHFANPDIITIPNYEPLGALLRSFADWIYIQLETEYGYLTSNEAIDSLLEDVDFDVSGSML